mmetsp:Transcript_36445/g.94637  ORF Transcript_36445/g.94637 Transcript_36445/m.94637 type:complete len:227 (-) Transcript_36445:1020-1700(-)
MRPSTLLCLRSSSRLEMSRTCCNNSGGQVASLFLSSLTCSVGSIAMRMRLRHLSFKSTALLLSIAEKLSFLMSAHLPPPHLSTPSTRAWVSSRVQNRYQGLWFFPLLLPSSSTTSSSASDAGPSVPAEVAASGAAETYISCPYVRDFFRGELVFELVPSLIPLAALACLLGVVGSGVLAFRFLLQDLPLDSVLATTLIFGTEGGGATEKLIGDVSAGAGTGGGVEV